MKAVPQVQIERPLFVKGPNLDFPSYKAHILGPAPATLSLLSPHFLDGKQHPDKDAIVMTSYPRSGNTLLRAFIEKIMGLVTGSDCDVTKKLNLVLLQQGLQGEGLFDDKVWVTKTHYPERYNSKVKHGSDRAILLIRSPLDCITSLFNMVATGSHDRSIHD